MKETELDFSSLNERLKFVTTLNPDDLQKAVFFFENALSGTNLSLTKDQRECLRHLVRYSANMCRYLELDRHTKETKLKAEYILLQKGKSKSKYPRILKLFGLNQKDLKKKRMHYLKNLYESLYQRPPDKGASHKGSHQIDYRISRKINPIRWMKKNDAEKKNSIIAFIKDEFYENAVTRNAVIVALRRAGAKNLPGVQS